MTRRGWTLFAAMSVIWGVPYLFIKIAVEDVEPAVVVFGRTALAGIVLLAVAAHRGVIRTTLEHWRWVLPFAAIEMLVPWLLLTHAEVKLPSGLTGLLVACVPLAGAVIAFVLGDHHAQAPIRLAGIAVGLGGVARLVGRVQNTGGGIPWLAVVQVMIVCLCYATGPFIVSRKLVDVPDLGVVAVALCAAAIAVTPLAIADWPSSTPPADALWSILGLAVICTGIAFLVFFALIAEIGPNRATLITFVNPAVAIILGAVFLDESITVATLGGFVLVLAGCWLATRPAVSAAPPPVARASHR
jgi:drug/metabolite transporter (DMT)-like permease